MSYPTLAPFVLKRAWLRSFLTPLASWYGNAAGYRQMGLRADDLIPEEDENVQLALKRLAAKDSYDRIYRLRRATQLSLSHKLLPRDQWTRPEDDVPYLAPLIQEIVAEAKEKENLDTLTVFKSH